MIETFRTGTAVIKYLVTYAIKSFEYTCEADHKITIACLEEDQKLICYYEDNVELARGTWEEKNREKEFVFKQFRNNEEDSWKECKDHWDFEHEYEIENDEDGY